VLEDFKADQDRQGSQGSQEKMEKLDYQVNLE